MELSAIVDRLDERLDTDAYADVDASPNGLQVGPNEAAVDRVAFAVDAAAATVERAAAAEADLLVTHHGVVWGGLERLTGIEYERVRALVDADLALYVSHLPLDGHPELGNAAGVADRLDLADRSPFGAMGDVHVGVRGRPESPTDAVGLADRVAGTLPVDREEIQVLDHGPDALADVAVVTGSGADFVREAADAGADALLTGEGKQQLYHESRELGVTVVLAGHYATETAGVRALAELVDDWGPETTFLDVPTGL